MTSSSMLLEGKTSGWRAECASVHFSCLHFSHLQEVLQHTDILGAAQHWSTSEPGCYARSISAEACFCASSSFPAMMRPEITAILFCTAYAKWQLLLSDTHAQKPLRRQVRDWPRHAPSPPLPPPVRATAQSRIALDTVERDCSAADMLLAPGKTSNVGEDEKSPIRLYGLATQLPNTKLSNGLQHDVILPMLAPLSTLMSFDAHGVPLWPQTGRRAGLVYRTRCRLGHCNHSSEVRPATCAGLLEGDAGPNVTPTLRLAAGRESRDSLLRRGAGSPSSSFCTMVRLHDTAGHRLSDERYATAATQL